MDYIEYLNTAKQYDDNKADNDSEYGQDAQIQALKDLGFVDDGKKADAQNQSHPDHPQMIIKDSISLLLYHPKYLNLLEVQHMRMCLNFMMINMICSRKYQVYYIGQG